MLHRIQSAFDWEIVRVPLLAGGSIGLTSMSIIDWSLKLVISSLTIVYLILKIRNARARRGKSDTED